MLLSGWRAWVREDLRCHCEQLMSSRSSRGVRDSCHVQRTNLPLQLHCRLFSWNYQCGQFFLTKASLAREIPWPHWIDDFHSEPASQNYVASSIAYHENFCTSRALLTEQARTTPAMRSTEHFVTRDGTPSGFFSCVDSFPFTFKLHAPSDSAVW